MKKQSAVHHVQNMTAPGSAPPNGAYFWGQSGALYFRRTGSAAADMVAGYDEIVALLSATLTDPVFGGSVTVQKKLAIQPDSLTDAATIATDASLGNHFRVTLNVAGATRMLGNPTNPVDGQRITWELIQDGTGNRALTFDTKFAFGTDLPSVTLTTTASKRDFLGAIYNSGTDKWYVVSFIKGY